MRPIEIGPSFIVPAVKVSIEDVRGGISPEAYRNSSLTLLWAKSHGPLKINFLTSVPHLGPLHTHPILTFTHTHIRFPLSSLNTQFQGKLCMPHHLFSFFLSLFFVSVRSMGTSLQILYTGLCRVSVMETSQSDSYHYQNRLGQQPEKEVKHRGRKMIFINQHKHPYLFVVASYYRYFFFAGIA